MIPNLTILENKVVTSNDGYIEQFINIDYDIFEDIESVGLDPGTRHIGLAQITLKYAHLWELTIPRENITEGRLHQIWRILSQYLNDTKIFVIEGASYADKYRQVELQDIRCGATAWAMNRLGKIEVQIIPPLTIRKTVFGSGKIKNPWKEIGIPDNAAAALGCALYALMRH